MAARQDRQLSGLDAFCLNRLCLALPKAPAGGSFTFMRYFRDYLTRQGIPWTHDIDADYDVLFLNSWTIPYAAVLRRENGEICAQFAGGASH